MLNPKRFRLGRTGLGLCLVLLAGVIFVADTYTDLEIAVAVLYVTVILVSVRFDRPSIVLWVGAASAGHRSPPR